MMLSMFLNKRLYKFNYYLRIIFRKIGVGFYVDWVTKHPCKTELKHIISPKCFPFPFPSFSLVLESEVTTNLLFIFPLKK